MLIIRAYIAAPYMQIPPAKHDIMTINRSCRSLIDRADHIDQAYIYMGRERSRSWEWGSDRSGVYKNAC